MTKITETSTPTVSKTNLGFWLYLMTDCVLFASLFATYAVLHTATFGGPGPKELFDLNFVLLETLILLTSSFACGLALLAGKQGNMRQLFGWLALTAILGLSFLGLELHEFSQLVQDGDSWRQSAFLSSFFTLVGTHGLHISVGLLWLGILAFTIRTRGLTNTLLRRLALFSMFWHFLDVVWIFIFTVVYIFGVSGL
jgi:cytochrome o ubiquinol oxidase subunit 3